MKKKRTACLCMGVLLLFLLTGCSRFVALNQVDKIEKIVITDENDKTLELSDVSRCEELIELLTKEADFNGKGKSASYLDSNHLSVYLTIGDTIYSYYIYPDSIQRTQNTNKSGPIAVYDSALANRAQTLANKILSE